MQDKFAYAYHDSLDSKIDSSDKINLIISKLEQESKKVDKKIPFSWGYYILK